MYWRRVLLIALVLMPVTLFVEFGLNLLRAQQLAVLIEQHCQANASMALCVSDLGQMAFTHPQWLACVFLIIFIVNALIAWPLMLFLLPKLLPAVLVIAALPSIYLQSSPLVVSLGQMSAVLFVSLLVFRRRNKAIRLNLDKLNKN